MGGFTVEENKNIYGAKIKVVGVGGGGGNMINHIVREGINNQDGMRSVDLIAANTDAQALEDSSATTRIQLGEKKTRGLGAGMVPEVGKEAALESYEEIKTTLEYSDIVFIASGFGGGTGTGAAPIIAQAAKEVGALTVAVITTPFAFEGKKRMRLALEGVEELKKECDSIVVIPNQKLMGIIDKKAGIKDSFKEVDNILARAVSGMSSIVLSSGKSDINLDFADVRTAMSHRGLSLMGVGEADGEEAAQEALKNAIQSPLLDDMNIKGAMGVLVHFRFHPSCPMSDISEAMLIVEDSADTDADIFFGTLTDDTMEEGRVQVTLVATGFYDKNNAKQPEATPAAEVVQEKREQNIFGAYRRASGYDVNVNSDDLDIPTVSRFKLD
ncbi:cell division protein FtsZ [Campylobacter fetus]|uniref:Cell division protein FtsZ n=1 Tax=Campylobacter fetus subsp. testudinum TaxID=1507806 RepID=A0AAX0HA19_CAMFE|nr:cell division protein FtsZ [Campylobacter fetus]AGZ81458.1 cell division protein FtsZ [Campylobacter fetus subsp. testudinum 03-427]AJB45206.1 cell division protein FtsZ [Campylobacter fetus subsp. testudinum]ALV64557.1 cell division protein FtsZ [Campylobacter fetus subsp. testudinum Sp3]AVK80879.1 cell division protein FtsZ [Campylobacter fetus subsp. testudinum]EAI4322474.1 cell division protein FtsZ [Campylobacter fetus]